MKKTLILCIISLFSFSCKHTQEATLNDLINAPKGEAMSMGLPLPRMWVYRGSDAEFHYVDYYYHLDGDEKIISYKLNKAEFSLDFEKKYSSEVYIDVIPEWKEFGKSLEGFRKSNTQYGKD